MSLIIACSICICFTWQIPLVLSALFIIYGSVIGALFVMKTSQKEDKKHLFLYLVSLLFSFLFVLSSFISLTYIYALRSGFQSHTFFPLTIDSPLHMLFRT